MSTSTTATTSKLGEAIAFPNSPAYKALTTQQKMDYVRNDALAYGYAWGRLDQGHPPIVTIHEGQSPSTTDTAWAFGSLYAQMLLELSDASHPRSSAMSVQSAWAYFAETGCPKARLPLHLG